MAGGLVVVPAPAGGARKRTGRGEGSSGLEFDRLRDLPAPPP
jgi:hypothetical protein